MNWDIFIPVTLVVFMFFFIGGFEKIGQFQEYILRKFGWIK
jgi:hypothetical protein